MSGAEPPAERERMKDEMSAGQRAYEARRAAKAGMNLDKWLAEKARAEREEAKVAAPAKAAAPKKPGLLSRLIERASKPL